MGQTVRAPARVAAFALLICLLAGLVGGFGLGAWVGNREALAILAASRPVPAAPEPTPEPTPEPPETNVSTGATLRDAVSYARRGPQGAQVEVVIFSDPRCPYCRQLAREVEPKLIEQFGDKLALTYRHFAVLGEGSQRAAVALDCAGQAGKFWEYHALVYQDEAAPDFSRERLLGWAREVGLDEAAFGACLDARNRQVEVDFGVGEALRVRGTPTTFVNGVRLNGALPLEYFVAAVEEQLRGAGR
jgi:protein-disulfide isomerase